jgi:O-antigen ligase
MMALFSQTSTTGSVISFILFVVSCSYLIYIHYDKKMTSVFLFSKAQIFYLSFVIICILSTIFNYFFSDYYNDFGNIGKLRYFFFAIITSFAFRYLWKVGFFTSNRVKVLILIAFGTLTIVTLSSIIGREIGYNFWKLKQTNVESRLEGAVTIGNYGQELPVLVLFFLGVLIHFKSKLSKSILIFLAIGLFINIYAIYTSGMRSALYGFFIAFPFLFYFYSKRVFITSVLFSCAVVATLILATLYLKLESRQFLPTSNASNSVRISIWKKSWQAFLEKPLLGHGYLSRNNKYLAEDEEGNEVVPLHIAHSSYIQVLKDTGILGISCYMLLLFFWLRNYLTKKNIISQLCLPAFICSLFHGVAHNFLVTGSNSGMLLAVLFAMSEIDIHSNT